MYSLMISIARWIAALDAPSHSPTIAKTGMARGAGRSGRPRLRATEIATMTEAEAA